MIPLEEYNGRDTKIKHKCTCGNIWLSSPGSVLQNNKCGKCAELIYESQLKPLNVVLIGIYINKKTKVEHRCVCGNIWDVAPINVLKGGKCGCGRTGHNDEVYKNRRTILYYIKINDSIYKPGVAIFEKYKTPEETILKQRYGRDIKSGVKIEILNYIIFDNGADAILEEKNILEKYKKSLYYKKYNDMNWFGGYRELITEQIIELVKENR